MGTESPSSSEYLPKTPQHSFLYHLTRHLPWSVEANADIKRKTGKGALNNLAFGAAISAQTVERMEDGDPMALERVLRAHKTVIMLDEVIEQTQTLGETRVNEIIEEIRSWWSNDSDMLPLFDEVVASMKDEVIMQAAYSEQGTIPPMNKYLETVVRSNGLQLIAAAYATVSTETNFLQRQQFVDEVWNANLEVRIRADWMKHSKDISKGHLDVFVIAAKEYPGMDRCTVEAKMREYCRPTVSQDHDAERHTSRFLKEYTQFALEFIGKATPILHLVNPLGEHDLYRK